MIVYRWSCNQCKVQRDADFRFSHVHQYASESVSGFYDRYLQEVGAWTEVGNAFVEAEIIIEGHSLGPSRSDWRNRFTDQYTVPVVLANLSYQKR